jgi:hypothetical protein
MNRSTTKFKKRKIQVIELGKHVACLPGYEHVTCHMKAQSRFFIKSSKELLEEQRSKMKVLNW